MGKDGITLRNQMNFSNMKLEEEIVNKMSNQMAREIDAEILWGIRVTMLEEQGWQLVNLAKFIDNHHAVDITYWVEENTKGTYYRNGRHFIFEDPKDATMFILRWS